MDLTAIHPYGLAKRAGCMDPDNDQSPGAVWLRQVASAAAEHLESGREDGEAFDPEDVHELADSAVPIYTGERWRVFSDLGAWAEDVADFGPFDDMTQQAGVALYSIAYRLMNTLAEEYAVACDQCDRPIVYSDPYRRLCDDHYTDALEHQGGAHAGCDHS